MLPYIEWTTIQAGSLTVHVWGLFVALGYLLGSHVSTKIVKQRGDDPKILWDLLGWLVIAGLIGGRIGHVLLYEPWYFFSHPSEILAIWHGGLSIFGGFIACVFVGAWFLHQRRVNVLRYADAIVFGLPFGLWIGRIGCFLIHDHPGIESDFYLAVTFPDGVTRHDLGLYLSLNGLLMGLVFLWLARKKRPIGTYITVFLIWYGIVRFGLDALRLDDVRYYTLTPAQYLSLALVAFGAFVAIHLRNQHHN